MVPTIGPECRGVKGCEGGARTTSLQGAVRNPGAGRERQYRGSA